MADVTSIVGAVVGTGALAVAVWKPFTVRHDRKRDREKGDDLFLHGAKARPGFREIQPAAVRLAAVELNQLEGNRKLDTLSDHVTDLEGKVDNVQAGVEDMRRRLAAFDPEPSTQNGVLHRD